MTDLTEQILWSFIGICALLALYMSYRGRRRHPSMLDFKRRTSLSGRPSSQSQKNSNPKDKPRRSKNRAPNHAAQAQPLNVIFEFENQSYDAYEILNLPAGSSWTDCHKAYAQITQTPVAQAALRALKKSFEG